MYPASSTALFEQNWPGHNWLDPRKLFKTVLFKPNVHGWGNAMNNLKNHVIYYTIGSVGISPFTTLITFKEFRWITTTQKDMTGGCYSLTLIKVMIQEQLFTGDWMRTGSVYALLNIAFYVEFYLFFSASIKELDNFIKELDKLKILSLHSSHLKSRPPGRAKKREKA